MTLQELHGQYGSLEDIGVCLEIGQLACCGIKELDGVSNNGPEETILALCSQLSKFDVDESSHDVLGATSASYIFTQAGQTRYGRNLRDFILKHKLGTVVTSRSGINPNTNHRIYTFVWTPNQRNLRRWWATQVRDLRAYLETIDT